ncbi:hypothetical protein [Neptunomonas phycophila]|uniref:hypothetical protein n=1 Tax=Neptunomonas phycophila TaxID=1572645 RepID=UPI0035123CE1
MKIGVIIASVLVGVFFSFGVMYLIKDSSLEHCIINNLKNVGADAAVNPIIISCKKLHPN